MISHRFLTAVEHFLIFPKAFQNICIFLSILEKFWNIFGIFGYFLIILEICWNISENSGMIQNQMELQSYDWINPKYSPLDSSQTAL